LFGFVLFEEDHEDDGYLGKGEGYMGKKGIRSLMKRESSLFTPQ